MVTRKCQLSDFATFFEVFDEFAMRLGKWQTLLVIRTAGQASSATQRREPFSQPVTFAKRASDIRYRLVW